MGLYPNNIQHTSSCLILVTDGECGKNLQLQFGNQPLRELYKEPFRWDQRFFCIHVNSSKNSIQSSLRALCDVTGGGYIPINNVNKCNAIVDLVMKQISPVKNLPLMDPVSLYIQQKQQMPNQPMNTKPGAFVNGGPVCTFSKLDNTQNTIYRAMLLHVPPKQVVDHVLASKPCFNFVTPSLTSTWCIPEAYFPNKKMDVLPPRTAQPLLSYTKNFTLSFGKSFIMCIFMKYSLFFRSISSNEITTSFR